MDRASNKPSSRLPAAVLLLGLTSLFTDISSEMIFPLLPAFLAARIGDAPLLLGAMEGLAELVASGFKALSGRWADRVAKLRPMVLTGYTLAGIARPLMGLVTRAWQPLLIRSVDRVGKGIRTSPRDALIASSVEPGLRGRAFGFHRGMDHAGAALGSLSAIVLVWLGVQVPTVFLLSAIPAALGVAALLFVREPERPVRHIVGPGHGLEPMPPRLWNYLVPVSLFALANSTDAFLLLKLNEQGAKPELLPLSWLLLHAVKALVSYPAGVIADRVGRARVVALGWALYAVSYFGLALSPSIPFTIGVILFYGLYHALSEGAEKALLADLAPVASRGRAFGLYHGLAGAGALVAGLAFGGAWNRFGSKAAFLGAAALAFFSLVVFALRLPHARARA